MVKTESFAMISDYLVHSTAAVSEFQHVLLKYLKDALGNEIGKVVYFSDGCKAQYKNKNNFVNIALHQKDHGMPADWHFFATAHGKGE